jgi:large subunit ribosomal protein L21
VAGDSIKSRLFEPCLVGVRGGVTSLAILERFAMYAVFETGGKQYRASEGDVVRVEKINADAGALVELEKVLLVVDGDDIKVGSPYVPGGSVSATVRAQGRGEKINIVKFRRRKHFRKQMGHRQAYTELQITGISAD